MGAVFLAALVAVFIIFKKQHFSVGVQPGTVNYPMMHAIKGGFFEKRGIEPDFQIFRSANDALDALLGGSIFVDAVIPIQNIAAIESDYPGSIGILALLISNETHPLDYVVVPSDSSINSIEELDNKTIVVFPGSYSETVTKLALKRLGIEGVKFIKHTPGNMPQAIKTGEADAGILYDPVATQAELQGWGRILERSLWTKTLIPNLVVGAYAFNRELFTYDPITTTNILKAIEDAILDARLSPNVAKRAAEHFLPTFVDVLGEIPDSDVRFAWEIDEELIQDTLDLYLENQIIPSRVKLTHTLLKEGLIF